MKKVVFVLICVLALSCFSFSAVLATQKKSELKLPNPGLTPDSFWYFLEPFKERLVILFTFDEVEKADKEITFSTERVSEAKKMIEEKKWLDAKECFERYQINIGRAREKINEAEAKNQDLRAIYQIVENTSENHLKVFKDLEGEIPESLDSDFLKAQTEAEGANREAGKFLKSID